MVGGQPRYKMPARRCIMPASMNVRNWTISLLAGAMLVSGCGLPRKPAAPKPAAPATVPGESLADQRARAYPEAAGRRVALLADFEGSATGEAGQRQVERFSIVPDMPDANRRLAGDRARTGAGAMEVTLPAGAQLVFDPPRRTGRDFSRYKLLSMAIYSRTVRDDLQVALESESGTWQSGRSLLEPGWNNVLLDIQRLGRDGTFDPASVRRLGLSFADAAGAVWFNLDDIMLIDNSRLIQPAPPNFELARSGLDYTLTLPQYLEPVKIEQGPDGLWRMGWLQGDLRLAGAGEKLAESGESLDPMGSRRLGQIELLEHNPIRIRLASTWYFPSRSGQWASMAVRQIRWEYTIYADGRCVVQGVLNNAGGREIETVGIFTSTDAAFHGGSTGRKLIVNEFAGEVGRWRYLLPPPGEAGPLAADNYLRPGKLRPSIAGGGAWAPGDGDRDGFDESQGCYYLGARRGQCRFVLDPPAGGVLNPVFVVAGPFSAGVSVGIEGLAIRPVVRRADGSVLFRLEGVCSRPTAIEVSGRQGPSPAR